MMWLKEEVRRVGRHLSANGKTVTASGHSCFFFSICLLRRFHCSSCHRHGFQRHVRAGESRELRGVPGSDRYAGSLADLLFLRVLKWSRPIMLLVNQPDWLPVTGLLSAKTDHKVTTEVVQEGNDFTWTQSIPNWSWSNKFKVGQECELVTMKGIKFKVSRRQSAETGCWAVARIQQVGVRVGISPCCGSPVGSSFYGRRENFRSFSSVPLHRRDHWQ